MKEKTFVPFSFEEFQTDSTSHLSGDSPKELSDELKINLKGTGQGFFFVRISL